MTSADASDLGARLAPALSPGPGFLRAPVAPATARGLAQLAVGWAWHLSAGLTLWIVVVVSAAMVPVFGIGLPLLALSLLGARWFAAVERGRLAAQTGVAIPAPLAPRPGRPGWWAAMWAVIRDGRAWAATWYAFVMLFLTTFFLSLATGLAAAAIAAFAFPFYGRDTALADWVGLGWPATIALALVAGVVLLWTAAVSAQYGNYLTVRLGHALLGPSAADAARARAHAAEQEARAAEREASSARERAVVLTQTRSEAVAAADAERRRIERDLHDGAQQRLVALGVELGVARRLAEKDPEAAAAAIELAHGEVKATLAELRDLVRGIHPAVLSDRGLDAALSALAARSPVPVQVDVRSDVSRASAAAQAAAYFVVAEALTNVAKHAHADSARVRADLTDGPAGPRLRVTVSDDGRGGAEPAPGSGLAGLRGRVAALDGTFDLVSPTGAGTRLTVEVPCAS